MDSLMHVVSYHNGVDHSTESSESSMDMDMGSSESGACQISMLWNWTTIDACFLTSSWHIRSAADFAGSCIGVILLVMALEALRRVSREYTAWLAARLAASQAGVMCCDCSDEDGKAPTVTDHAHRKPVSRLELAGHHVAKSILHAAMFCVAYIVMLLAMYFNGYIIICLIIGAGLGHLLFAYDTTKVNTVAFRKIKSTEGGAETTGCCG